MTDLDDKMLPKALALIAKFGKSVTWTAYAESFNPATSVNTRTPTARTATIKPPQAFRQGYVDGDLVRVGDLKTGIAASGLSFTPKTGDTVLLDTVTYEVMAVWPIYSGTSVAVYDAQLRGPGS